MFGHQDDNADEPQDNQDSAAAENQAVEDNNSEPQVAEQPAEPAPDASDNAGTDGPQDTDVPSSDDTPADQAPTEDSDEPVIKPDNGDSSDAAAKDKDWQHPGTPLDDEKQDIKSDEDRIRDVISPAGGFPKQPSFDYPTTPTAPSSPADNENDKELADIRKQALDELSPLVDKLDLPPEEKFHTIMMIIQTSDDQKLVEAAYEAAHSIEDEKAKAQALYDIVNEINYFTQPEKESKD